MNLIVVFGVCNAISNDFMQSFYKVTTCMNFYSTSVKYKQSAMGKNFALK